MEQTPDASIRPSHIPRPSRLPVPRPSVNSTVRQVSPSSRDTTKGLRAIPSIPRLRPVPSRDQLLPVRTPSTTRTQEQDISPRISFHVPSKFSPRSRNDSALREVGRPTSQHKEHGVVSLGQGVPGDVAEGIETTIQNEPKLRKTQVSLSERAIETLAQLPPSPAVRKRRSSFFNPDSPMRPPSRSTGSRPGSSYQSDASMPPPPRNAGSRPTSSAGFKGEALPVDFRSSTSSNRAPKALAGNTPIKGSASTLAKKTPARARSDIDLHSAASSSRAVSDSVVSPITESSPSIRGVSSRYATMKSGSHTVGGKSLRARPSIGGLFRKPSMPDLSQDSRHELAEGGLKKTSPTFSNTSSEGFSIASRASKESGTSVESAESKTITPRKSSLALRDQIAKAKAAKRAQIARDASENLSSGIPEDVSVIPTGTFDFGLAGDPFNQRRDPDGDRSILRKRINSARTDGRLNVAAMGLKEIPLEVMNMYNLDTINDNGGSWAESVDLIRLIAADNELTSIADDIFPDIDPAAHLENEDDSKSNQFGGLETLDLHGNLLQAVPIGLRRLHMLTTLNLSYNKLENDCFDVISQIANLRDLKLGHNSLSGALDTRLAKLQHLEALDVQQNQLTTLPQIFTDLTRLRVLNVSGNQLASLSLEVFQGLPLMQLLAANNKLTGHLCVVDGLELSHLQVLDVTTNALTSIASGQIRLPALHQLSCSSNRLRGLPDMSSWLSLVTLSANDNSISAIPESFTSLPKVKNVDLNGNDIRLLNERIGLMECLDTLSISGNPLREKKLSGMTTEDLKRALRGRLTPEETDLVKDDTDTDTSFATATSSPAESPTSEWLIEGGGLLDRSHTNSHSLNPVIASQVANTGPVRILELHHNLFKEIPSSIAFFAATLTTVNLTHNELTSDTFLTDELDLPALKELNLSSNTFNSVQPLIKKLRAPQLARLDISFNRLTFLPALRAYFPGLTAVLASNNSIKELSPESVEGLKVIDCSSNELNSLNARIGLLGGPGGLERLDVRGNRFRVPNYSILDKGTEATLAWLRNRIPAGELNTVD